MPIPLSPNYRFGLVLNSDQARGDDGKPLPLQPAGLPTFEFRYLSGRDQRAVAGMLDELEKQATTVAAIDHTYKILRFVLAGWENLVDHRTGETIGYDPERAEDVLQYLEAQELIYRVWGHVPTAGDLGNCVAPSSSPSDGSAPTAPAKTA